MKHIHVLIFFFILSICLCSCGNKPYPQTMQVADSLVNSCPDSALVLLEQLKGSIAKEPEATQMYYRLLTIKAKDKAYITHASDSLIKRVVNYYERKKDREHLPEAYYFAGRVHRDLGDAPQALDYFQKALETSNESTEYRLISMMYNQTAMLFLYQGIYDKALKAFKEAYHYTKLSGDSTLVVYNLCDIGRGFTGLNKVDSTLYYYKEAEKAAMKINNAPLIGMVNQDVADIYIQLGEYQKARTSLLSFPSTVERELEPYYSVLTDLYYEVNQIDSAQYYCVQLLSIGNHYHKQGAYEVLSKIARRQGKLAEALGYIDQYLIYTDSIRKTIDAEAILKIDALYNYQLREKEIYHLEDIAQKQKVWIVSLAVGFVIIFILIFAAYIIYWQQKKRRKIQAERQQEILKAFADEQYHSSRQFIAENEKRIEVLKERLQRTEDRKDELEQNLQEAEKELLELTNKQIEAKQKIHILSEAAFRESQIYKRFYHVAGMSGSEKEKITQKEWEELTLAINRTYNNFTGRLQILYPSISQHELRICVLIKIAISPMNIAELTIHSKQAITSSRKKLYERVHNQKGTPDLWDAFIQYF